MIKKHLPRNPVFVKRCEALKVSAVRRSADAAAEVESNVALDLWHWCKSECMSKVRGYRSESHKLMLAIEVVEEQAVMRGQESRHRI